MRWSISGGRVVSVGIDVDDGGGMVVLVGVWGNEQREDSWVVLRKERERKA